VRTYAYPHGSIAYSRSGHNHCRRSVAHIPSHLPVVKTQESMCTFVYNALVEETILEEHPLYSFTLSNCFRYCLSMSTPYSYILSKLKPCVYLFMWRLHLQQLYLYGVLPPVHALQGYCIVYLPPMYLHIHLPPTYLLS
jgi:hypothetical protein